MTSHDKSNPVVDMLISINRHRLDKLHLYGIISFVSPLHEFLPGYKFDIWILCFIGFLLIPVSTTFERVQYEKIEVIFGRWLCVISKLYMSTFVLNLLWFTSPNFCQARNSIFGFYVLLAFYWYHSRLDSSVFSMRKLRLYSEGDCALLVNCICQRLFWTFFGSLRRISARLEIRYSDSMFYWLSIDTTLD